MSHSLRLLLLEDSDDDADLILRELNKEDHDVEVLQVDNEPDYRQALTTFAPDLILSDYALPAYDGHLALEAARQLAPDTPFIFVSGTMGEEVAIEALKQGATDYVLKDGLIRLRPAVRRALQEANEHQQRLRAEKQIGYQADLLQLILDTVPDGVVLLDNDSRVTLANPAGERLLTRLAQAAVGATITALAGEPIAHLLASAEGTGRTLRYQEGYFELLARPIVLTGGDAGWVLLLRDVTAQHEQEQYMAVQARLATVGQLAAGIAHDFNNVMAVITLYTQLLQKTAVLSAKAQSKLDTIAQQAQHASDMITQILDFSRRAIMERVPLNLLPFLKELTRLLRTMLPETLEIELTAKATEYMVNADPARLQQAMMNIALNARDAMPHGGRLRLALDYQHITPDQTPPLPDLEPGHWLHITITDEGVGIAPDILPHIFDPFFTTKEPGKGTGLGLAQVHGIVKQHGGSIGAESRLGEGTTFMIYLPALTLPPPAKDDLLFEMDQSIIGHETILLVQDNKMLRITIADTLSELGYQVLQADNGLAALTLLQEKADAVDLILSDVIMPQMDGISFYRVINQRYPTLPLLLMTGYPLGEQSPELADLPCVTKPFTIQALASKIRALLA